MSRMTRRNVACLSLALVTGSTLLGGCAREYKVSVDINASRASNTGSWSTFAPVGTPDKLTNRVTLERLDDAAGAAIASQGFALSTPDDRFDAGFLVGCSTERTTRVTPGYTTHTKYGSFHTPPTTYHTYDHALSLAFYDADHLRSHGRDASPVWQGTITVTDVPESDPAALATLLYGELLRGFPRRGSIRYAAVLKPDEKKPAPGRASEGGTDHEPRGDETRAVARGGSGASARQESWFD